MEKNSVVALIVIALILLLWPVYMKNVVGIQEPEPMETSANTPAELPPVAVQTAPDIRPAVRENVTAVRALETAKAARDTIILENDHYRAALSTLGGGTIVSWKLKKYLKPRKMIREEDAPMDQWVEMIPDTASGNLSLIAGADLSQIDFQAELEPSAEEPSARFTATLPNGGTVEKHFQVLAGRCGMSMDVRLKDMPRDFVGEEMTVSWKSGLAPTEVNIKEDNSYYQGYALQGGELLKSKGEERAQSGNTDWVAVRTKYFMMAIIPEGVKGSRARIEGEKIRIRYGGQTEDWKNLSVSMQVPYDESKDPLRFQVFVGPMDYLALKHYHAGLEKLMNFGWTLIRPFSVAFFYTLQFLYGIVKNYGWAIIIFSILIKVALHPLTRKSYQSMRAMQELQPKLNALKEKYKNDPQKMNQETMKMYKQHGVNPMGGCLPLLLQMPVLFALFSLFRTTIMLRQASFLGVIHDLSAADQMIRISGQTHINVLPILMGATMIIQQKLSTQSPQQKAMAYMMPIMFTFMFYNFSAGLNLYYLMFNVLTILQELFIKKHK